MPQIILNIDDEKSFATILKVANECNIEILLPGSREEIEYDNDIDTDVFIQYTAYSGRLDERHASPSFVKYLTIMLKTLKESYEGRRNYDDEHDPDDEYRLGFIKAIEKTLIRMNIKKEEEDEDEEEGEDEEKKEE